MTTVFHRVGAYEILHQVGSGGMAAVFLATDTRTNRRVALKLVSIEDDNDGRQIIEAERLGNEAAGSILPGEPVRADGVRIRDAGQVLLHRDGVPGRPESLRRDQRRRRCRQSVRRMSRSSCASSSRRRSPSRSRSTARQRGPLLHGDLKPRNIRVLADDEIKVFDFGIAKALSLSRKVTRNDFGSTAYLSPERIESGDVDAQAEFWAVGILLYEMVSGVQPFQAPDTRRLEQRIRARRPPALLDGRCPVALQAVIAKLLAGNVADRYGSAGEIRDDLQRFRSQGRRRSAQRDGWPAREHDEAATRRTHRPPRCGRGGDAPDRPRTRRRRRRSGRLPSPEPPLLPRRSSTTRRRRRAWSALARRALMVFALFIVWNEISVIPLPRGSHGMCPRSSMGSVEAWNQYEALSERSLRIGTRPLERALIPQTADADGPDVRAVSHRDDRLCVRTSGAPPEPRWRAPSAPHPRIAA